VLNILPEHNFQDAFKNGRNAGNGDLLVAREKVMETHFYAILALFQNLAYFYINHNAAMYVVTSESVIIQKA
jgi:hypothetical protein